MVGYKTTKDGLFDFPEVAERIIDRCRLVNLLVSFKSKLRSPRPIDDPGRTDLVMTICLYVAVNENQEHA